MCFNPPWCSWQKKMPQYWRQSFKGLEELFLQIQDNGHKSQKKSKCEFKSQMQILDRFQDQITWMSWYFGIFATNMYVAKFCHICNLCMFCDNCKLFVAIFCYVCKLGVAIFCHVCKLYLAIFCHICKLNVAFFCYKYLSSPVWQLQSIYWDAGQICRWENKNDLFGRISQLKQIDQFKSNKFE